MSDVRSGTPWLLKGAFSGWVVPQKDERGAEWRHKEPQNAC